MKERQRFTGPSLRNLLREFSRYVYLHRERIESNLKQKQRKHLCLPEAF